MKKIIVFVFALFTFNLASAQAEVTTMTTKGYGCSQEEAAMAVSLASQMKPSFVSVSRGKSTYTVVNTGSSEKSGNGPAIVVITKTKVVTKVVIKENKKKEAELYQKLMEYESLFATLLEWLAMAILFLVLVIVVHLLKKIWKTLFFIVRFVAIVCATYAACLAVFFILSNIWAIAIGTVPIWLCLFDHILDR